MTLRDQIETDATTVFCNTDDFAEQVVYHPRGGGCPRPIHAVVMREGMTEIDGEVLATCEVHVANSGTAGVASYELVVGQDCLSFPPRDDKTPRKHTILNIVSQDNGMLVLLCR